MAYNNRHEANALNEDMVAAFLKDMVARVESSSDSEIETMKKLKKLFKKNVPFSRRSYVAALLIKNATNGYKGNKFRNNDNQKFNRNEKNERFNNSNNRNNFNNNYSNHSLDYTMKRRLLPQIQANNNIYSYRYQQRTPMNYYQKSDQYENNNNMVKVGNFIMKNDSQFKKSLKSDLVFCNFISSIVDK